MAHPNGFCPGHGAYFGDACPYCPLEIGRVDHAMITPIAKPDMVNHPPHYKAGGIEAIDVIDAFGLDYLKGNATKYILRAGRKGDEAEDLEKAVWYLKRRIAALHNKPKVSG